MTEDSQLSKLNIQEQRLIDAYREGAINLLQLKEQKAKLATRRKVLEAKKEAALSQPESLGQPEITLPMLGDVSARYHRVMAKADFATKEKLANLLINSVTLFPGRAVVESSIRIIQSDALIPPNHRRGLCYPELSQGGRFLRRGRSSDRDGAHRQRHRRRGQRIPDHPVQGLAPLSQTIHGSQSAYLLCHDRAIGGCGRAIGNRPRSGTAARIAYQRPLNIRLTAGSLDEGSGVHHCRAAVVAGSA